MKKKFDKQFWGAVSLIIGTAVGAGIFGIPYVTAKVGFLTGMIYIFALGFVIVLTTLFYAEVTLRTKEKHQLPGYAFKYLGKKGKILALVALIISIYGAMIAYTIEIGVFLNAIFGPIFGGAPFIYSLIFYILAAIAIYIGLKTVAKIEMIMVSLLLVVICIIIIAGVSEIKFDNFIEFNVEHFFLPYGVILFALGAGTAIPDARFLLKNKEKKLFKATIIGIIIPIIIYIVFTFLVVGISGVDTTQSSIIGLGMFLGSQILIIGSIFGLLTMSTSFLSLGNVLKETLQFDFKIHKIIAWLLVMSVPLIIYLLEIVSFIEAIGFAGGILGGIEGLLIVMIYRKARKEGNRKPEFSLKIPKFLLYIIYLVFIGGILYVIYEGLEKWVF